MTNRTRTAVILYFGMIFAFVLSVNAAQSDDWADCPTSERDRNAFYTKGYSDGQQHGAAKCAEMQKQMAEMKEKLTTESTANTTAENEKEIKAAMQHFQALNRLMQQGCMDGASGKQETNPDTLGSLACPNLGIMKTFNDLSGIWRKGERGSYEMAKFEELTCEKARVSYKNKSSDDSIKQRDFSFFLSDIDFARIGLSEYESMWNVALYTIKNALKIELTILNKEKSKNVQSYYVRLPVKNSTIGRILKNELLRWRERCLTKTLQDK